MASKFYTVLDFMVFDLKLKGLQKDIYAIIYGFCMADKPYTGGLGYLADWTQSTKQGVIKALKELKEKGLIETRERYENGVKFVDYYAPKFNGIKQSLMGYSTEFNEGIKLSLTNNINNNIDNNIDRKEYISKDIYKKSSKFQKPTLEELKEYCSQMNYKVDAEKFYLYYEQCGWTVGKNKPMKDWRASLRLWNMNQAQYQEKSREQSKVASLNFSNEECEKQLKDEVIPF